MIYEDNKMIFNSKKKKEDKSEFNQLRSQFQTEKEELPVSLIIKDQSFLQQFSGRSGFSGRSNIRLQNKEIIEKIYIKGMPPETIVEEVENEIGHKDDILSVFVNLTKMNVKSYSENEIKQFLLRYQFNVIIN